LREKIGASNSKAPAYFIAPKKMIL